jgi:hypothetical protein
MTLGIPYKNCLRKHRELENLGKEIHLR